MSAVGSTPVAWSCFHGWPSFKKALFASMANSAKMPRCLLGTCSQMGSCVLMLVHRISSQRRVKLESLITSLEKPTQCRCESGMMYGNSSPPWLLALVVFLSQLSRSPGKTPLFRAGDVVVWQAFSDERVQTTLQAFHGSVSVVLAKTISVGGSSLVFIFDH